MACLFLQERISVSQQRVQFYYGKSPRSLSLSLSLNSLTLAGTLKEAGYSTHAVGKWQHSFVEIDHEIFSTVILSLPLIQEGQLSVSGERMCTTT